MINVPEDWGNFRIEYRTCGKCQRVSISGKYGWQECPNCVPGQLRPLLDRVSDPASPMGPDWVWIPYRGPRGIWEPVDNYMVFEKKRWSEAMDVLSAYMTDGDVGLDLPTVIRRVLVRIGDGRPAAAERPKISDLADRCSELDRELRAKRVQCDEQRDRIADLEAALEKLVERAGAEDTAELSAIRRMIRR